MEFPQAASVPPLEVARVASAWPGEEEREALRASLTQALPEVPPRYFYDDRGSALFEQITVLDAYYQTRTEIAILESFAPEILRAAAPRHLVELGSGAGRKIRLLLDAWPEPAGGLTTMLDINELFLRSSLEALAADYPEIEFRGVVGDFVHDLHRIGPAGRRLVVFFAGTIGNLKPDERHRFLCDLADHFAPTDAMLVGVDLVKPHARLEAAYDDPQGVTAAFNLNMLNVLNSRFGANFNPANFRHRAFFSPDDAWIEMRLVAKEKNRVRLDAIDLTLDLARGDEIRTEVSCKFTRPSLQASAEAAGLRLDRWWTDPSEDFALALLRPQPGKHRG